MEGESRLLFSALKTTPMKTCARTEARALAGEAPAPSTPTTTKSQKENKMAAIPITVDGLLYDLYNRTTQRVILIGDASLTGVGVGGGPIVPSPQPPGVWPGPGPSHPIMLPGMPGWGSGGPPTEPPSNPSEPKPPPADGGWGWHPEYGWGYFPMGGGKPQPPAKK